MLNCLFNGHAGDEYPENVHDYGPEAGVDVDVSEAFYYPIQRCVHADGAHRVHAGEYVPQAHECVHVRAALKGAAIHRPPLVLPQAKTIR